MGKDSKIEWTDHTFNPWWGCTKVSPGCSNCYAESFANRFGDWWDLSPRREFDDRHWNKPLKWDKRAAANGKRDKVFCGSMCDILELIGVNAPAQSRLWDLIERTPHLIWMLLTKRPKNAYLLPEKWFDEWPDNVWMGTSVENQEWADKRIPLLLEIPAKVRWLSAEPLLGEIDLTRMGVTEFRGGLFWCRSGQSVLHSFIDRPLIHWVIVGGESGTKARPMDERWACALRNQCYDSNVPFFMKQMGGYPNKRTELEDIPSYLQIKEFPNE